MNPGLNAIVGPSVSGNTLLLDILAARKDASGISGDVWVHEVPEDSNFPHNTGYVVQDDVAMDTLSVRENLWFSAALRLPTTMTKQEKKERINNIIKELDLEEVADSKVITLFIVVESKGERKKTSIGMELILDPLILFLDEPTTGLDGRTTNDVFTLLKRISQQGRTIIFTIHQPCYSIFKLFDSLTILASGELMYHGPAQKALEYFQSAGFPCKFYNNPAELFLDITDGVIKRDSEDYEVYKTEMCSRTDDSEIKELAIHFSKSTFYHDTKTELEERSRDENRRCLVRKEIPYVTSFVHQIIGLIRRSFQNFSANPQYWATLGIVKPGLNAIMGPQGGGKSLLLDILVARKDPMGLSGNIWIHGVPEEANFQCNSGYVLQDDVMLATLTVVENLWFSASLQLPRTMTILRKKIRIYKVLTELNLSEVAYSKVESKELRKVTSIGMELALDPSILFLDEPTIGLDWNTAYKVIKLLKRIPNEGGGPLQEHPGLAYLGRSGCATPFAFCPRPDPRSSISGGEAVLGILAPKPEHHGAKSGTRAFLLSSSLPSTLSRAACTFPGYRPR
ncbi:broad substrate specificity ATP-binding cassette transporter ABCG2 [Ictidomys tridecemlineatus]